MFWIVFSIVFLIGAIVSWFIGKSREDSGLFSVGSVLLLVLSVFCIASTSIVIIDGDKIGLIKRTYGTSMPAGAVIALGAEAGPLAKTLSPGFHFELFINVLSKVEEADPIEIPAESIGILFSRDGAPLPPGQNYARKWEEKEFTKMLDAEYFLGSDLRDDGVRKPRGQQGTQITVLPPGKYRLNKYLFNVETHPVTTIEAGFVGVVKSNIQEVPYVQADVDKLRKSYSTCADSLSVTIVPEGYLGIWSKTLLPGKYYLNDN